MEPEFYEGEVIVIDPTRAASHNDFSVVRVDGGPVTLKQLILMGRKKYLKPLNQRYPVVEVHGELITCGVVVSKYKAYL